MTEIKTVRGEITPRDLQVAKWVARGKERNEVASILGTSRPAVNRHMTKIMKATESRNGTQAVATLMALGLLHASDVNDWGPVRRKETARRIAPGIPTGAAALVPVSDVVAYLGEQRIPKADGEVEQHFNWCIDGMIQTWSQRLPIPGPRRDPDAPRPPQQPDRDDR